MKEFFVNRTNRKSFLNQKSLIFTDTKKISMTVVISVSYTVYYIRISVQFGYRIQISGDLLESAI